ncbi:MAG: aminopeptidase N [Enterobacterales bacterium]|jgi:aminopeptidase N
MRQLNTLLIILLASLITACNTQDTSSIPLAKDYKRIDADWLTQDEAILRHLTVSNIEYLLRIDLTKSAKYTGFVEIRFDYKPSSFPLTVDFVGGEAEQIAVNNTPIAIDYNGNFINIASQYLDEGRNTVKIQYSHTYSDNGSGLYRYKDPTDDLTYLYTHFEPYDANKLFPSFDQPNLRATYELKVVAPKEWTVVSSVRESQTIIDGPYKRWKFPKSPNFSTYIFPLHAGPWHIWEGKAKKTPIRLMTRQSLSDIIDVREWFRITQQGFKFYEEYFDSPYPFSKYDQLLVPDFNIGGMENVGAVTFTENYIPRGSTTKAQKRRVANTILHELSHMWFGDLVTIDWWNVLWLKESFASYMAPLALSEATEYKDAWRAFYSRTKQSAYQADQRVTTHPIEMLVTDTKSGDASFDSITYNKGASVLQQLSHYLGKDTFRDGIRNYLKEHKYKAAKLTDFFDSMKKTSGKNLQNWTYNWINLAGVNSLLSDYECNDGKISDFKLLQTAPEENSYLRTQKLQVGLYQKNTQDEIVSTKIQPVLIKGAVTRVKELIGESCPLLVYPNHSDWGYIKVELDKKSLLMLPKNINSVKNDLLRSMFWQSMWDMVLDIKMPLTDYLELLLINISLETDTEILNQLLSNISQAQKWISSSESVNTQAKLHLENLELLILQEVQITTDGSDLQKIWFQYFIDIAQTARSQNHLSNWLQDNVFPLVLNDNQDMRWDAIISLSAAGHPGAEQLLAIELSRDTSDKGAMMAIAANASLPNLEIKQYWLDELMRNEERQTAAKLKQAMSYLFPAGQSNFQKAFAEQILNDLHYLDSHRGQVLIETLVDTILPSLCSKDSVELLAQSKNNMLNLGLIAQKGIKISHQEDARCVAINELLETNAS